jgi:hypothetical protein
MAEPLFLCSEIAVSKRAFQKWLKAPAVLSTAISGWPEDLLAATEGGQFPDGNIGDLLVEEIAAGLTGGSANLLCCYDDGSNKLRFAAFWRYGDEASSRNLARWLCAQLGSLATLMDAKTDAAVEIFDGSNTHSLFSLALSRRQQTVQPSPNPLALPTWFGEWLGLLDEAPLESILSFSAEASLARQIRKIINLGAAQATPEQPHYYDTWFHTDGKAVFQHGVGVIPDADPTSFRRLTPGKGDDAFFGDRNTIWYCMPFTPPVTVQTSPASREIKAFRPFGADGSPLLLCTNTLWHPSRLDYQERRKTAKNIHQARKAVLEQGGIVVIEAVYNLIWLRPERVDGATFRHLGDGVFEDQEYVYQFYEHDGLVRFPETAPGTLQRIGEFWRSGERLFYGLKQFQESVDLASFRHLWERTYADDQQVYLFSDLTALRPLDGADPARYQRAAFNPSLTFDGCHVWFDGVRIEGADGATVNGCDGASFFHFWEDARHVYYGPHRIEQADPASFHVFPNTAYARQGKDIYYMADRLDAADAESFTVTDGFSAKDCHRRYYYGLAEDSSDQ